MSYGAEHYIYQKRQTTRTRIHSITVSIFPRLIHADVYRKDEGGYCHSKRYRNITMTSLDRIVAQAKRG